jgi:hypothetical protein
MTLRVASEITRQYAPTMVCLSFKRIIPAQDSRNRGVEYAPIEEFDFRYPSPEVFWQDLELSKVTEPCNEILRYLITWTIPCTQTLSSAPGIFDG